MPERKPEVLKYRKKVLTLSSPLILTTEMAEVLSLFADKFGEPVLHANTSGIGVYVASYHRSVNV